MCSNEKREKLVLDLLKRNQYAMAMKELRTSHEGLEEIIPLMIATACRKAMFADACVLLRTLERLAEKKRYFPTEQYDLVMLIMSFPPGCNSSWVLNIVQRLLELVPWPTHEHYIMAKTIMGTTANFYGDAEKKMKSVRLPKYLRTQGRSLI